MVGFHINRLYNPNSVEILVRCAVSIKAVQDILIHTDLYNYSGGLTWSFGCYLSKLKEEYNPPPRIPSFTLPDGSIQSNLDDVLFSMETYGTGSYCITTTSSFREIERIAGEAFEDIERFGWPFLDRYSTEEGALELTLRDDDLANLCFLDPRKALTGLILAKKLNRLDVVPRIFALADKRLEGFAQHGNPEPRERFDRLLRQLGLNSMREFSLKN
ncbi:hypothetical protein BH10PSE7_BH10PSE7_30150 [soil metagenome]